MSPGTPLSVSSNVVQWTWDWGWSDEWCCMQYPDMENFPLRVVEHWDRLPRVVWGLPLWTHCKPPWTRLCHLPRVTLTCQGSWIKWSPEIPSKPKDSVILWNMLDRAVKGNHPNYHWTRAPQLITHSCSHQSYYCVSFGHYSIVDLTSILTAILEIFG